MEILTKEQLEKSLWYPFEIGSTPGYIIKRNVKKDDIMSLFSERVNTDIHIIRVRRYSGSDLPDIYTKCLEPIDEDLLYGFFVIFTDSSFMLGTGSDKNYDTNIDRGIIDEYEDSNVSFNYEEIISRVNNYVYPLDDKNEYIYVNPTLEKIYDASMESYKYNIFTDDLNKNQFVIVKYLLEDNTKIYTIDVYNDFFSFEEDLRYVENDLNNTCNGEINGGAILYTFVINNILVKNLGYHTYGIPNEELLVPIQKTGLFTSEPVRYMKKLLNMDAIDESFKKRTKKFIEQIAKCDKYILRFDDDPGFKVY